MQPTDFNPPDAAYAPVDGPLFLGVPPLLALLLLVLLVLAAASGWIMGRRWHQTDQGQQLNKAPQDIHRAVLLASERAMTASSNDLRSKAQALRTAITDYLGPVLAVAKGVTGPVKELDEALSGEIKDTPKAEPAPHRGEHDKTAHDKALGCGCGKPQSCACKPEAGVAGPTITVTHVQVGGPQAVVAPASAPQCGCGSHHRVGCEHDKPKPETPKPEKRPMTGPEQIEALSKAIRAFHDHWSSADQRIAELVAARDALSRRPPEAALSTDRKRVWERF